MITDLVGSTRMWEEQPDEPMSRALARHDETLRRAIEEHGGVLFSTMGDGIAAVFASAGDALRCALDAQRQLTDDDWQATGPLRARIGLHSDEGRLRAPDQYVNRPINRCARLMAVAHGGQILVSNTTAVVGRGGLPSDADLLDLGEHRLRDLAEPMRVFQLVHPSLPATFPPLRSLDALPGNLPRQLTSFVGREREVAQVSTLVRDRTLVTLTGVGGVGKTRLALEVAAEVAPSFPDGVWVCELAPVTDPAAVWETLAASLGVRPGPGRPLRDLVLEHLGAKRALLVVDNCEHLLSAVADVVDAITRVCAGVAVLATSREGLALAGEQIVAVPALTLPGVDAKADDLARADAVELFCERALEANNAFELTSRNWQAVAQLCRRLDGIPLALELAAARARSLPPEELVARLDQRFRLLTRGSRAALERHQTLRNTIDWSYDLLTGPERTALNRMSAFAGACDLDAAEAVLAGGDLDADDVVDLLGQLVDKSLVDVESTEGRVRYRLLESIRQYAAERLEASGETSAVRSRHLELFVARSEAAGPHLRGREQLAWAAALERDTDNIRAALDWAVEAGLADRGLRLVVPMMVTGVPTGWIATDWAETAIGITGSETHELFPVATAFAALRAAMQGDLARSDELIAAAREAQDRLGTDHLWVHTAAGVTALFRADFDASRRHAEHWLALARERNDEYEIAHALILLGSALQPGDPVQARVVAEEAVRRSRDAGIATALLYALFVLAIALGPDDPARARALMDEALDVGTKLKDWQAVATVIGMQGGLAVQDGDWRIALRTTTRSAEEHLRAEASPAIRAAFGMSAIALVNLGRCEPAAVIVGLADTRLPSLNPSPEWVTRIAEADAAMLAALGSSRVDELKARGAALTLAEGVAYLRAEADRALEE